jgi:ATP-binding cassette subfamily B protein
MAIYWAGSELLCVSQNGLNLLGGAWLLAHGYLSVGTLFGFMALVAMMLWPVRQMGSVLTDMGKALVAIGRVREILVQDHESDLAPAAGPVPETGTPGAVEFRDVTFGYTVEHPVLRNVSFAVAPGETLAIVGPTGSGKTTLINLLLRLHDLEHGSIMLNGIDVRRIPRATVRRQVSVVLQQPFLFSKTLRENIAHGRGDESRVTLEEIEAVATASCVHEAIREFEHGYDTEVGEKGVTLSGGQRQRVALARALLRRPPMLVLDDALSAVDTHTETRILAALEERRGRQTTLIITHRLSSLRLADKILVLDHGRITQFGTHAELIAQPGLYRELWSIQGALEEDLREEMEVANAS